MRCLHPLAAAAEVGRDLDVAAQASEANRAPDGAGWTDVHVIQAPEHDYAQAGLPVGAADAALAPILPRVRRFAATAMAGFDGHDPFGTYEEDAYCYGVDASLFVKLETDGAQVRHIWFQAETGDPERLQELKAALLAVDRLVPSIVADYWLDRTGPVGDLGFFDDYLAELADGRT
ncbi:MAG: hypothetical protein HOV71_21225 [Hamadaea sp.]|nr:hypothetical protein [Hamadaea sp.]NUR50658.1 hypothetical protein [Hamadaea sp.]NUT06145.1 hypothetical protein [Hamadaea sp.]